jgi:hypothetical protein
MKAFKISFQNCVRSHNNAWLQTHRLNNVCGGMLGGTQYPYFVGVRTHVRQKARETVGHPK